MNQFIAPECRVPSNMEDRFLILCALPNERTKLLRRILEPHGKVEVVSDFEAKGAVFYQADDCLGFNHLARYSSEAKEITAWEKAWLHISETIGASRANMWLVEDDVMGPPKHFDRLVQITREIDADFSTTAFSGRADDPGWPHWGHGAGHFHHQCRSFNPLCRLSDRLVMAVLEFRRTLGRFVFQEVLFASLVAEHGLSFVDWIQEESTRRLFGEFRFRPEVFEPTRGICHPVKSDETARLISLM